MKNYKIHTEHTYYINKISVNQCHFDSYLLSVIPCAL